MQMLTMVVITLAVLGRTVQPPTADIVGKWILSPADSVLGNMPAPRSAEVQVDRNGDAYTITTMIDVGRGPNTSQVSLTVGGPPVNRAMPDGTTVATTLTRSASDLTMRRSYTKNSQEVGTDVEQIRLSADGQTLSIARSEKRSQGERTMTLVYKRASKQP